MENRRQNDRILPNDSARFLRIRGGIVMGNVKNKLSIRTPSVLLTIVATILIFACFFLPYIQLNDEGIEALESFGDDYIDEENNLRLNDMFHISLAEYVRLVVIGDSAETVEDFDSIGLLTTGGFVAFVILSLLCTLSKKVVGTLTFGLLALGAYASESWYFAKEILGEEELFTWGIGHYIFYAALAMLIAGAVWMMVDERKGAVEAENICLD